MKQFRFGLEKILKLRRSREEEAKLELGKAVSVLGELEMKIEAAAEEKFRAMALRFVRGASEIVHYDRYILRLDKNREALLEAAVQAELAVEEARGAYMEASRDRQVMDKLRDRRLGEYRRRSVLEEIAASDDISGGRRARSGIGG
ncbi:MAG: flagellar export protein FliJ [Treponema sp.]|nr:flagellar export protein FliJ [Treponema sp.]